MSSRSFERFERGKRVLETSKGARDFERWSSPHTHPGGSAGRLIIQKARVLVMFAIRRIASGGGRRSALNRLRALKNSASNRDVLVVGSGPSADSLNGPEVAKAQNAGELTVVATNYFLNSPLAKSFTPDFLVWSDSVFHPRNRKENPSWDLLATAPEVNVVVPWTWKSHVPAEFASRVIFFDDDTLETWSTNVSPLKPRGYQGTTGVKALAIGIHFGPKMSHVIGLDLSYFKNFTVDKNNVVWRHPSHLSGTDSGVQDLSADTVSGFADNLFSAASQFLYLRKLFSRYPVINLDPSSLVDAFPKVVEHRLVRKSRAGAKR